MDGTVVLHSSDMETGINIAAGGKRYVFSRNGPARGSSRIPACRLSSNRQGHMPGRSRSPATDPPRFLTTPSCPHEASTN